MRGAAPGEGAVPMMRVCARVALTLLGVSIIAAGAWGTLALAYAGPPNEILRSSLAAAYAFASLAALIGFAMRGRRWRALGAFVLLFALLLAWWSGVEPSNNRDWQTDVALLPRATIDGELVTLHNIRNFDSAAKPTTPQPITTNATTSLSWRASTSWPPTGWGQPSRTPS